MRYLLDGEACMTDAKEKYEQALMVFSEPPTSSWKQLMVAICLTQLGDYPKAQHSYILSLRSSLEDRLWHLSGEIHRLVDTYVLANQPDFYPRISEQIEGYKLDPRGGSLSPLYAYALTSLVIGEDEEATDYVRGLLEKPKIKWTFAAGRTVRALIALDQLALDDALDELLEAHRGMAKFGGLRETPEGYLCLPAMSLSKMALERDLEVNVVSEYLARGYLNYLLQRQDSLP
jgi:tetratricopeptide (TPR) repeat protein